MFEHFSKIFKYLFLFSLLFVPFVSQAEGLPSDATTVFPIVQLNAGNSYSYTVVSNATVLNFKLHFDKNSNFWVAIKCDSSDWYFDDHTNIGSQVEEQIIDIQKYCAGSVKIYSSSNTTWVYGIFTYVPRDIANTDDPNLPRSTEYSIGLLLIIALVLIIDLLRRLLSRYGQR